MNIEKVRRATLCYLIKNNAVNLPIKKRKVGVSFRNGYGGHIREDESPEYATIREILEESHSKVNTRDLNPLAILRCHSRNEEGQAILYLIYVYWTKFWKGEPEETEETGLPTWFDFNHLPVNELMPADRVWIQQLYHA